MSSCGYVQLRWVDIAIADIDTISIFLTQNIGDIDIDIDIFYCSALWPTRNVAL